MQGVEVWRGVQLLLSRGLAGWRFFAQRIELRVRVGLRVLRVRAVRLVQVVLRVQVFLLSGAR